MQLPQLEQYRGASVQIRVDDAEAIGILFFDDQGAPYITTLCYVQPGRECPLILHSLSDEELQSLSRKTHNQLHSRINLSTKGGEFTEQEKTSLTRKDDELLMERIRRVNAKSKSLIAQSEELKKTSAANHAKLKKLHPSISERQTKEPPHIE